jgi:lysophospholipase L1-like esterase
MTARGRLLSGLIATVIALAGFVTVGAPTAAAGPTGTLQYVALGDSYAAGIGAPPYVTSPAGCLQSNKGYPALLDPKGRIDLQVNATCPGATTTEVAVEQVPKLTSSVELVTLTVGGNDLGFAALAGACLGGTQEQCQAAIQAALALLPTSCEGDSELGNRLTYLYAAVAAAAPNALIVVTGYPRLFEPVPPNLAIKTQINAATTLLNCAIANAVKAQADDGVNIVYVDVTDAFEGHGIGALDDPFINAPVPGQPLSREDFHPNAAGYRAYAKAISAAIRDALDRQKQVA